MALRPGLWSYYSNRRWYMVLKNTHYVCDGWGELDYALKIKNWDFKGENPKPIDMYLLPLELI